MASTRSFEQAKNSTKCHIRRKYIRGSDFLTNWYFNKKFRRKVVVDEVSFDEVSFDEVSFDEVSFDEVLRTGVL